MSRLPSLAGAAIAREQLARHATTDAKEARDRGRILALLDGAGDAFARDRFDPGHITGSAFVLDASEEHLLMLHHARLDRWLQPGGHAEPGETDPLATARREAEEESGIAGLVPHSDAPLPFDVDVHAIPARAPKGDRPGEPAHEHFDVRYLLVAPAGAKPVVSDESHAVRWLPLERAAGPDADAALVRAIGKVRAFVARRRP